MYNVESHISVKGCTHSIDGKLHLQREAVTFQVRTAKKRQNQRFKPELRSSDYKTQVVSPLPHISHGDRTPSTALGLCTS